MSADRRPMLATPQGEHKEEVGLLAACLLAIIVGGTKTVNGSRRGIEGDRGALRVIKLNNMQIGLG